MLREIVPCLHMALILEKYATAQYDSSEPLIKYTRIYEVSGENCVLISL